MTELGTALRELAGQAEAPHPADPEHLWSRGRARVRRNRAVGVAVATAAAIVVLFSTSSIPEPHQAMPAGPVHAPAIPMNVYQPNRFLARISDTGPPGRLALIARGDHGWFGISATTGRYTALDLPGLATDAPVSLSPDGTRIAYGVTGPTRKKEFGPPTPSRGGGPLPPRPIVGLAVYDLRTGDIVKQVRDTDYGLAPSFLYGEPSWLGDKRVEFGYNIATGSNTSVLGGAYVWDISQSRAQRLAGELEDAYFVPTTDSSVFVRMNASDVVLTDDHGTPTGARIRIKGWEGGGPSFISVSRRFVFLAGPYGPGNQHRVSSAQRPASGSISTKLNLIGDIVDSRLVGWVSQKTVLVTGVMGVRSSDGHLGLPGVGYGDDTHRLYEVDLATRKIQAIGYVDPHVDGSIQVARDLLGEPMVRGQKPPSILAVFRTELIVASGLLAALGCWFVVRRRRRG